MLGWIMVSSNSDFHGMVFVAFVTTSFAFNSIPFACLIIGIFTKLLYGNPDLDLNP